MDHRVTNTTPAVQHKKSGDIKFSHGRALDTMRANQTAAGQTPIVGRPHSDKLRSSTHQNTGASLSSFLKHPRKQENLLSRNVENKKGNDLRNLVQSCHQSKKQTKESDDLRNLVQACHHSKRQKVTDQPSIRLRLGVQFTTSTKSSNSSSKDDGSGVNDDGVEPVPEESRYNPKVWKEKYGRCHPTDTSAPRDCPCHPDNWPKEYFEERRTLLPQKGSHWINPDLQGAHPVKPISCVGDPSRINRVGSNANENEWYILGAVPIAIGIAGLATQPELWPLAALAFAP